MVLLWVSSRWKAQLHLLRFSEGMHWAGERMSSSALGLGVVVPKASKIWRALGSGHLCRGVTE